MYRRWEKEVRRRNFISKLGGKDYFYDKKATEYARWSWEELAKLRDFDKELTELLKNENKRHSK